MALITETTPARILALIISIFLLAFFIVTMFVLDKNIVISLSPIA
jgi:hypothetical protein